MLNLSSLHYFADSACEGGDLGTPFVKVLVDAGDNDPLERWSAARRDIMAVLDDLELSGVEVEIQDPDRCYRPSLFPILPKHPAVAVYKAVREDLLAQIHNTIGSAWQALSLFHVGRTANVKKPTVVLMVDPLSEYDWSILKASLEAVIGRQQDSIGTRLRVEIMPGTCQPSPPAPEEQGLPGISSMNNFNTHPGSGTSIGVLGERGGETLGGYFTLKTPTRSHTGFLTNSHVVAPPASSPSSAISEFDLLGLPYRARADNLGRTRLGYFAGKDVDASLADGNESVKSMEALITEQESEERTYEERGTLTPGQKVKYRANKEDIKRTIRELREMIETTKTMPLVLGRTILASGRALTTDLKTLDYAFVEGPVGNTRLPPRSMFHAAKAFPKKLGVNSVLAFAEGSSYHGYSSIRPGQWYFKVGRTTGLTGGLCNGVETWIKPAHQHTLWDAKGGVVQVRRGAKRLHYDEEMGRLKHGKDGKPLETEGNDSFNYTSEWVIVNGSIEPLSEDCQEQFCNQGDSGSLIIDILGNVAGILWGDVRGWCGPVDRHSPYIGAGLVTDINDVMAGMKVAVGWPENATVDVLQFVQG